MALIGCPECGKEISDTAISCPHCGYQLQHGSSNNLNESSITGGTSKKKILLFAILGIVIVGGISLVLILVNRGGSGTPEKALDKMINCVSKHDYQGIIDCMLPQNEQKNMDIDKVIESTKKSFKNTDSEIRSYEITGKNIITDDDEGNRWVESLLNKFYGINVEVQAVFTMEVSLEVSGELEFRGKTHSDGKASVVVSGYKTSGRWYIYQFMDR